jgi:hypothetical protein
MRRHRKAWTLSTVACVVGLVGCAQTTVRPAVERQLAGLPRPERILVFDPAVTPAEGAAQPGLGPSAVDAFRDPPPSAHALEIGREVAAHLATELVASLRQLGLPAERSPRGTLLPTHALLIESQLLDVEEGSRLQRTVIGFGAGQSRVEAQFQVYTLASRGPARLLAFITHADSGKLPGAAVTLGAGAAVAGAVTAAGVAPNALGHGIHAYRAELNAEAGRSAAQAVAYLSEFFAKEGWIAADQVQKAKRAPN